MRTVDYRDKYRTDVPHDDEPMCTRCQCGLDYTTEDIDLWGKELLNVRMGICPICGYAELTLPLRQGDK